MSYYDSLYLRVCVSGIQYLVQFTNLDRFLICHRFPRTQKTSGRDLLPTLDKFSIAILSPPRSHLQSRLYIQGYLCVLPLQHSAV
jgi:hypothetical protein